MRKALTMVSLSAALCGVALADFTYEQTSTITGGAMMSMMKLAGAFSKQAREPMKSTVMVRGDQMVTLLTDRASIIDLAKETITEVDFKKKTYSVITFAEMKQVVEQVAQKAKSGEGKTEFKISAKATGESKKINGLDAKEILIKMDMESTDPKSGQKGTMSITTDSWFAAGVAGYDEVRKFQLRMAQKISWAPSGGAMLNRPDIAQGMSAVSKEVAKMDGVPVLQTVRMGMAGTGADAQMTPEQREKMQQQQQAQQQQQQQQQQVERPSVGGVLGGALGGRFGGLGRKKKTDQSADSSSSSSSSAPAASGGQSPEAAGSLMEMTTEVTNYSAGPVDASKFEVPSGFKQVERSTRGMQ